jgi:sortase A
MNEGKKSREKHCVSTMREKHSLSTILIVLSLVLGAGCIGWALINIQAQSMLINSADSYIRPSSISIATQTKQYEIQEDDIEPKEPETSSDVPHSKINLYPLYPAEGENIGDLIIPALNQVLPIVQGTDSEELKKGVGHYAQSVLPGEEDNCVLSGHRDTFFSELGELKLGDQLVVQTSAGTFTYEINNIRIVDKDDKTVIVPADHAMLTLTTCYPFIYVGSAPDRYIITADLVISK